MSLLKLSASVLIALNIFLHTSVVSCQSQSAQPRQCPYYTVATDANGSPSPSQTASLKIGRAGPVLLSDSNLVNSLAHFDRERIPERVVHAKGAGAHGYFEVTNDITKYTKADVFSQVGKQTPIFARFSGTMGQAGSADQGIDTRGFAVKFYTEQGNWDLTCLSTIIFSIREPFLFPSLIRSAKKHPRTHLDDPNMRWDFRSFRPEQAYFLLQVYSDIGLPAGYRHMNAAAINAFKFVNANNEPIFVKFHLISSQGFKSMTADEAATQSGANPDYFVEDLYTSIEKKNYPEWKLFIQVMTECEARNYRWNPFDATKEWLLSDFPLIPVGRLVFNRNPVDHFSEVEMSAFSPSSLVPGIEMSPDPLLHGRSFSYADSQRHRMGPNFQLFDINRPKYSKTYDRDGTCAAREGEPRPNYFPNSFECTHVSSVNKAPRYNLSGIVDRTDTGNDDNFSQAKLFLKRISPSWRSRLIDNLAGDLSNVLERIREVILKQFAQIEVKFSQEIRMKIAEIISQQKQ